MRYKSLVVIITVERVADFITYDVFLKRIRYKLYDSGEDLIIIREEER